MIFPSIKTIIVLNMTLSITGSLSAFEPPYVITKGEFGTGTYFVIMDKLAHASQKVGFGIGNGGCTSYYHPACDIHTKSCI